VKLMEGGQPLGALLLVLVSLVMGLAAAGAGLGLSRLLYRRRR
jgi:fluoride ion exporter CrcB/FEX